MGIFRDIRQLPESLHALAAAVRRGADVLDGARGPLEDLARVEGRLEELERSRALWEAEMEAALETAEHRVRTARAAEERSRGMEKRAKALTEAAREGDEEGEGEGDDWIERYVEALGRRDGAGGAPGGVPPVREDVAGDLTGRERARRTKFGR